MVVVLLLLLSGDVETNPGPVGEGSVFNSMCTVFMVCEKGTHGQRTLQVCQEGSRLFSSVSTFNHKRAPMHVDSNLNQLTV